MDDQSGVAEAQVVMVDGDQLGAAQRTGKADQQQGARSRSPARSSPQVAIRVFTSAEVRAAAGRTGLPCWRRMPRIVARMAG